MDPETHPKLSLYDGEGDVLLEADGRADRVILLPAGDPHDVSQDRDRIRIQWGQHLLADLGAGRYRTLICAINDTDNSHGIVGELVELIDSTHWCLNSITSYSRMFHRALATCAPADQEPFVLKYDLRDLLVMALLRPQGHHYFTLDDLARGFRTIVKMLKGRRERWPVASTCFLGAKSNRLVGPDGREPSLETVLQIMYEAGYRGDVYPCSGMWEVASMGVYATYPFPDTASTPAPRA
jgi:hypothetical protein